MNIFENMRGARHSASSKDALLFETLGVALNDQQGVSSQVASRVFATESISEMESQQIQNAASNLQSTLSTVAGQLGFGGKDVFVQESAAVQGALSASAGMQFWNRSQSFPVADTPNLFRVEAKGVPNYLGKRTDQFALEAFDNRETRSAVLYTMAFNYSLARQDEFGETVWPTLTLPADQVGFGIVVNRLTVHRGATHTVDGKVVDFGKIDLMRAAANHNVLLKERTRLFPVVRSGNEGKFVDTGDVATRTIDNEGIEIKTAPLKVGEDIGLIGISQTDAMLAGGSADFTDTLDPAIALDTVYVKFANDVMKFKVYNLPTSNFTYAPQGIDKDRVLNFRTMGLRIVKGDKKVDGGAMTDLSVVDTQNLTVIVEMVMTGRANTEFGSVQVFGNSIKVVKVLDADGQPLGSTSPHTQDVNTKFQSAKIIGYDLRAYRTNLNMRERGNFIDRTSFTQLYEVPLLSPVTAMRPQNTDGHMDGGDFEALVTTTRFRLMNDAVTAILDNCQLLADFVGGKGAGLAEAPNELGAARFHVRPYFAAPDEIDVTTMIDSVKSSDRMADLQAGLVNVIRDHVFRMYVQSEYQAAAAALGQTGRPTAIIATDPIIHRYLMVHGDLRTLTDKFDVKVVSTLDERMAGKVFVTFGVFDETRNSAPNILNWGNLVWAPEVVMSATITRGEKTAKETIVQPRYRFVMHLPVAALLQFKKIPDTLNKVPVHFKNV